MNYLNLPKPHGWLLWRGKKKAIANDTPLPSDTLLVVSGDEAYGYVTLSSPSVVSISEFERLEEEHLVRREDRKLYWPDATKLYLHRLKEWQPFESTKLYTLSNNEAELVEDATLTPDQLELIKQAERLPKTLVLLDEAVTLCDGKAIYCEGVNPDRVEKILDVTLDGLKSADSLPLYQLALVRIPRLSFKQKKSDIEFSNDELKALDAQLDLLEVLQGTGLLKEVKAMPYTKVKRGDEWCVIQTDTEEVKKCHDNEQEAIDYLAALKANVDEGKSVKELIAEARKCYYDNMPMPVMSYGPASFTEWDELEEAQEIASDIQELNYRFSASSSIIFQNPEIADKGAALSRLANEYSNRVEQVGKKELEDTESQEDDSKIGKRIKRSMKDRLKQAWETIKEVMDWAEPDEEVSKAFGDSSRFDIKQVNGVSWFISHSANAFEDREGEIFSTKSLEKYVAEADELGDKGFFNVWHIGTKTNPGLTDFAKIEWQGVVGKFLVEAGPFLDNAKGQAALRFFTEYPESHPDIAPEGWGSSVEYKYLKSERETKVYQNIWKTRTSALPRKVAANTWTKGTIMALSPEQTQAAKAIFGDDLAAQIIKGAEGATKELEDAGVASKEVTTETTTEVKTESVVLDEGAIIEKVAKQVGVDFEPIAQVLTIIVENQAKQDTMLQELAGRIKSLEKTEDVKTEKETSRFMVSVLNRASQADKTIVSDEDPLKNQKPVEQQVTKTGAAAFFPAR